MIEHCALSSWSSWRHVLFYGSLILIAAATHLTTVYSPSDCCTLTGWPDRCVIRWTTNHNARVWSSTCRVQHVPTSLYKPSIHPRKLVGSWGVESCVSQFYYFRTLNWTSPLLLRQRIVGLIQLDTYTVGVVTRGLQAATPRDQPGSCHSRQLPYTFMSSRTDR
jgi:hypothetical protein